MDQIVLFIGVNIDVALNPGLGGVGSNMHFQYCP
jgi:hypothetical protein